MARIVVENMEETIGPWLLFEYINAAKLCKDIMFTNICSDRLANILGRYGRVYRESFIHIIREKDVIVLDPSADKPLEPEDTVGRAIVIGGILGDDPPKGRTKMLLTDRYGLQSRNIGDKQYSIDGAVYVAHRISEGESLENIKYVDGLEIDAWDFTIQLPYRYPVERGRPLASPILTKILKHIGYLDEYWMRELFKCKY